MSPREPTPLRYANRDPRTGNWEVTDTVGRSLCIVPTLGSLVRSGAIAHGVIDTPPMLATIAAVLPMGRRKGPSVIVNTHNHGGRSDRD